MISMFFVLFVLLIVISTSNTEGGDITWKSIALVPNNCQETMHFDSYGLGHYLCI